MKDISLTDILNSSLLLGIWPNCYKKDIITPIPKEYPVLTIEMLRPISSLLTFNKIQEMAICELILKDMSAFLDPTQYGNRKRKSIAHYLIRMVHRILSETDKNSRGEVNAILCTFIDWQQAYSRQSHILGIKSFIENGVRPSLIPLLTNYFSSREMKVKWHGKFSRPRKMPGSGAMGSNLGNIEFDSQTNSNANCVPQDNRFKFVDDLTILEVVNLLNIGISSLNIRTEVPNDLPTHGQYVDNKELKSQIYLNEINRWTEKQQMVISSKKTKAMIVNFTDNYQFHTRLQLKNQNIDIVDRMKILGTVFTNKLNWTENCDILIRKVNNRMQLLRTVWSFGSTHQEMVHLWIVFCRSVLEQSCVVWDSGLTLENIEDLERTQKTFAKLVLEEDYRNYSQSLEVLGLEKLETRRKTLSLRFVKSGIEDGILNDLFPHRTKTHTMHTRKDEYFKVTHAYTERFRNSPILTMQRLLNNDRRNQQ